MIAGLLQDIVRTLKQKNVANGKQAVMLVLAIGNIRPAMWIVHIFFGK